MASGSRARHSRRRRRGAGLAAGALAVAALALPATAGAASQSFCSGAWMGSGWECRSGEPHTLQSVEGYVATAGSHRICAASAAAGGGTLNSDWVCGYSAVIKTLNGRAYGVGIVHNGSPYSWQLWSGFQSW
jgi:hypothetical protein